MQRTILKTMRRWKDQDRTPRHPTALHYLAHDFILLDIAPSDMKLRDIAPLGITSPDITLPNIAMPDVALLDFALLDITLRDITPHDVTLLEITLPDISKTTLYCLALLVEKTTSFQFWWFFINRRKVETIWLIPAISSISLYPIFIFIFPFACAQFHSIYFSVSFHLVYLSARRFTWLLLLAPLPFTMTRLNFLAVSYFLTTTDLMPIIPLPASPIEFDFFVVPPCRIRWHLCLFPLFDLKKSKTTSFYQARPLSFWFPFCCWRNL